MPQVQKEERRQEILAAAIRAFAGGTRIERYLWHARRILSALGNRCVDTLSAAGISVVRPVGAFYLFLDFTPLAEQLHARGITSSRKLCEVLLNETGVAILPGSSFGRPEEELTARLAYVDFDGARAMTASETVPLDQPLPGDFAELQCYNVVKAVQMMAQWVRT